MELDREHSCRGKVLNSAYSHRASPLFCLGEWNAIQSALAGRVLLLGVDLQQRGRGGVQDRFCLLAGYSGGREVVDRAHEDIAGLV
jgi:hypothetical protein